MAKGFKHGGSVVGSSDDLGFKIITCSSEDDLPEAAENNTIAIFTDGDIIHCDFYRGTPYTALKIDVDPENATGAFLIATGKYSPVYFDIENGNNSIRVYPTGVYQRYRTVDMYTRWVEEDARIYKNGQWMSFDTDIYNYGDQCESVTGEWGFVKSGMGTVSFADDYLYLGCDESADSYASVYTKNKIDFSEYTQMIIYFENLTHVKESSNGIKVGIVSSPYTGTSFADIDSKFAAYTECAGTITKNRLVVDLTDIHKSYEDYVEQNYYVQLATKISNATIRRIYLCADKYVS